MKTTWLDVLFELFRTILDFVFIWFMTTFMGAISGLLIGLFFGKSILGILSIMGISGFSMWQIGAFLGFVQGFLRIIITSKK